MAHLRDQLKPVLQVPMERPVVYLSSTESFLLRQAEALFTQAAGEIGGAEDIMRLDGPAPDMGELIAATGAISLFGGTRVVVLRELSPAALTDKDAKELAELFGDLENAVLFVTALQKDKRTAGSKKAKGLFDAAKKNGFSLEITKPGRRENIDFILEKVAEYGAQMPSAAADALLERAGEDRALLENEVAKLAAMAGYGTITADLVERYGVHQIETDVFALLRCITAGRRAAAFQQLGELFALKHEPIAIAGALGGSYVDMLRVRTAAETRRGVGVVFSDMGYTGNEYRLQKAKENAARYSTPALEAAIGSLAALDRALKSSALAEKSILVEATVAELLALREGA